jgi:hypothetical protein
VCTCFISVFFFDLTGDNKSKKKDKIKKATEPIFDAFFHQNKPNQVVSQLYPSQKNKTQKELREKRQDGKRDGQYEW